MAKSADAFRTISEVAEWLGSPAHVLRFWESKFTQVKPVKRAGGRRYYRPADMLLLGGIKKLLHDDGMTIKGVQKILREQGVKYVSSLSQPLDLEDADMLEGTAAETRTAPPAETGPTVLPFPREEAGAPTQVRLIEEDDDLDEAADTTEAEDAAAFDTQAADLDEDEDTAPSVASGRAAGTPASDTRVLEDFAAPRADAEQPDEPETVDAEADFEAATDLTAAEDEAEPAEPEVEAAVETESPAEPFELPQPSEIPAFLHRAAPATAEPAEAEPEPEPLRPAIIDLPPDPQDDDIIAAPGLLSALAARRGRPLSATSAAEAAALRDSLAALVARHGAPAPGQHPE